MEKINKQFIIDKINAGNDIFSTTNPNGKYDGSFSKELEWIKENLDDAFCWEQIGESLWKLIRK